jgi:4-hydroxyphenylacetate 3-monooxygenase
MAVDVTAVPTGARTGAQYLAGLRNDGREVWMGGERIDDVVGHPLLGGAAQGLAGWFDWCHEHAETCLYTSPTTGLPVNVSFLQARSREDLERRRKGLRSMAEYHGGVMGRAPDYLNVTFALFAARADVWARRGNERGAENLVRYYELMREHDLSTTHAIMNPQVDRSRPDATAGAGEIALHKVGESAEGIVVRGARMLATLAPYADEISIYPGSPLRPEDTAYALCFALPMNTPGLKVVLRDSFAKPRPAFDYPLSSRFDEQDGMVIFDDVVVPWERVFMDGDTVGYDEVISHTNWRAQIVNQAMVRAWTKLEFTFGLAHAITEITGVNRFDHVQEKLGEIWSYVEMTRSGVLASEVGSYGAGPGELAWTPDERPLVALRGLMPRWIPRAFELTRLVGGAGFMATPSLADVEGPIATTIEQYYQAGGAGARDRIRLFRLAWDLIGSDLGSRGELYERFYLQDAYRMTALAYVLADKTAAQALVDRFLQDEL